MMVILDSEIAPGWPILAGLFHGKGGAGFGKLGFSDEKRTHAGWDLGRASTV
jgi:hypothetical protein